MALLQINPQDNVAVALHGVEAGATVEVGNQSVLARQDIPTGHKIALAPIAAGEKIVKYGFTIGIIFIVSLSILIILLVLKIYHFFNDKRLNKKVAEGQLKFSV